MSHELPAMSDELNSRVSENTTVNMSETMAVESHYLSAGANRYSAAADWSDDGLVAFGSASNVCLWDPTVSLSHKFIHYLFGLFSMFYFSVFGC